MVMPRSRSRSMSSRYCAAISRGDTAPVRSRRRSASVDFPWSMCAMMEKFRMLAVSRGVSAMGSRARGALPEERDRLPEAVPEGDLGPPAEPFVRPPGIDDAAPLLARLGGAVTDLGPTPRRLEQQPGQRVDVGLDAGADVHGARDLPLDGQQVRPRHVPH